MKVKELIEALQKFDGDKQVITYIPYIDYGYYYGDDEEVFIKEIHENEDKKIELIWEY